MNTAYIPSTGWFTSSFSQAAGGNCVEVNRTPDTVYVRHSRHPAAAVLHYTHTQWDTFTRSVKTGEFHPGGR